MSMVWLKSANDKKSFRFFATIGAEVKLIDDLEQTDNEIRNLIKNNYNTIVLTNEVASFSENIIRRYNRTKDVRFIITPSK